MAIRGNVVDEWKIEVIRKYLEEQFSRNDIDHFPKGGSADLFLVMDPDQEPDQVLHQLLITRRFFDRFLDHMALREALVTAEVAKRLKQAGQRTVELY